MNEFIKKLTSDKVILWSEVLAVICLAVTLITLSAVYRSLPPFIPLFNQMPWGEERLGQKPEIFLPLFTVFSLFLFNLFFSGMFYEKMPLITRILAVTNLLIAVLVSIFVFRTIQLLV